MTGHHVAAYHPGHGSYAGRVEQGRTGVGIGPRSFRGAMQLTEQIELVTNAEAGVGEVHHWKFFLQGEGFAG